jgi:hypothetical protein
MPDRVCHYDSDSTVARVLFVEMIAIYVLRSC